MTAPDPDAVADRIRREPPRFRQVVVDRVAPISPYLVRVTLTGPELAGFAADEPAASVRLLLPSDGTRDLIMPSWTGNEFRLPDGSRAVIRTFTPVRVDPTTLELDIDVVLHDSGIASDWGRAAAPGDAAAISGPGRGYTIDLDATEYLVGGDESAIPAIRQLLDRFPPTMSVRVFIEVSQPDARIALPLSPGASVTWLDLPANAAPGDHLVAAITQADLADGTRVWVAGEAAAVQRARRHLFTERGIPRAHATVRGYWKHGRAATDTG